MVKALESYCPQGLSCSVIAFSIWRDYILPEVGSHQNHAEHVVTKEGSKMLQQSYACTFKLHFTRSIPKPISIINTTPYLWVIENSIHIIKSYILIWLKVRWFVTFLEPIIFQNLWNWYSLKRTKKSLVFSYCVW